MTTHLLSVRAYRLLTLCFIFLTNTLVAQKTALLKPAADCGKDAFVWYADNTAYDNENQNYSSSQTLLSHTWTTGGQNDGSRILIDFDLSLIPVGSNLLEAKLSLYNDPTSTSMNGEHSNYSHPNASYIRRITSTWNENEVTWNTQPTYTTTNEVMLDATTDVHQNFEDIDVTAMAEEMLTPLGYSGGFMLMLQDESPYCALVFASSNHPDPSKHPSLLVTYEPPTTSIVCSELSTNKGCHNDAFIWNALAEGYDNENINYSDNHSLLVHAWTTDGVPDFTRTLLYWDLSNFSPGTLVDHASLSLFNDPTSASFNGEHQMITGTFQWEIRRISQIWLGDIVTWNSQPSVVSTGEVILSSPTDIHANFENIDISTLVQDMIDAGFSNYGLEISLSSEDPYSALVFASGENLNPALHPKLLVCINTDESSVHQNKDATDWQLYPNPAEDIINFTSRGVSQSTMHIFNSTGQLVKIIPIQSTKTTLDISDLCSGIYVFQLQEDGENSNRTIIID
ncbi:MAG: T9SS type A sorting domain-containing protein [Flavobacteriales bacterium]|nr:T9SS type A sorting domain-containing protein [Flavobacteriales bacterium]